MSSITTSLRRCHLGALLWDTENEKQNIRAPLGLFLYVSAVVSLMFAHHRHPQTKEYNLNWGKAQLQVFFPHTVHLRLPSERLISPPLLPTNQSSLLFVKLNNNNFLPFCLSFSSFLMASSVSFPYFSSTWWLMVSLILYLKEALGKTVDRVQHLMRNVNFLICLE